MVRYFHDRAFDKLELNIDIFFNIGNKSISENASATAAPKTPESAPGSTPVLAPE